MSGITNLSATRRTLRELARVVKETRQMLATMMAESQQSDQPAHSRRPGRLSDTLHHLEDVREGFILSQRTSSQLSSAELRALVKVILLGWNWLRSMTLVFTPGSDILEEMLDD